MQQNDRSPADGARLNPADDDEQVIAWTTVRRHGPNHLGLFLNGPVHLGLHEQAARRGTAARRELDAAAAQVALS